MKCEYEKIRDGKRCCFELLCALLLLLTACGKQEVVSRSTEPLMTEISTEYADSQTAGTEAQAIDRETGTEYADGTETQAEDEPASKTEEAPEAQEITLLMTGDMLLHTPVEEYARQEDGSYRYDAVFGRVAPAIAAADVAIVNQEVILGGEELGISGYPSFNAPFAFGEALMEAGFDVVCHATNHALDKRKTGLLNCVNYWRDNHPEAAVLGIHDSQESGDSIYVYEKNGIRVAILNYTYGTNGVELPDGMPYAVDLLKEERVAADIRRAEEMADFTVVCPHWGTEYRLSPDDSQKRWTRIFMENGADLVIGTHPHVIEPFEWVEDEESGRSMLVYYSLGNFVNWTSSSGDGIANRMVGGMAEVTLSADGNGGVVISEYGMRALVTHLEKRMNGVEVYFLSDYTDELAGKNAICAQDPNFSLEYCIDLCDRVWGEDQYY